MNLRQWMAISGLVLLASTVTMGARVRPGGDPRPDRIIWADPFDNYSEWADANQAAPAFQPRGTLWQGGPVPAGSITGTYPWKSADDTGCGVTKQYPGFPLARAQWVSNNCQDPITTPAGFQATAPTFWAEEDDFVEGSNCGSGGWVETIGMYGRVDSVWQAASSQWNSLGMFTHDLTPRIQSFQLRSWDTPNPTAVNGTDEHPLTLIFDLHDSGSPENEQTLFNNAYIELNLDDEHAPTDYIWRGKRDKDYDSGDPECCPEGPFPIICQQVREVNIGNFEQQIDLTYLNDHCPSLVPAFNPETGTGKDWPAIAFGFLAVGDKDPCTCAEQGSGSHMPTMNHPMLFNGNVWRELRNARGTGLTTCPPSWGTADPVWGWQTVGPETTMAVGTGASDNFSLAGGVHQVYLKLTTSKILIWMHNASGDYCGAFDRVYTGPFNRVSWGVGPGCELKDKATEGDDYACKAGSSPQCLTYSSAYSGSHATNGYFRSYGDSMSLLDGVLVQNTNEGACCKPDGECVTATQSDCTAIGGIYHGMGTLCEVYKCCPMPFADRDHDGDVDPDDFGAFQVCYTGATGGVPTDCECFDRNNDGNVNETDLQAFINCWTGPNVPWTAGLTPSCVP